MRQDHPDLEVGTGIAVLVLLALVLLVALAGVACGSAPRSAPVVRDCGHDESCGPDGPCVRRR